VPPIKKDTKPKMIMGVSGTFLKDKAIEMHMPAKTTID